MLSPRVISLIGYRGTGKSTVGRQLGLRLGWDWVDADVEIELAAGKSIAAIFADDGESAFRDLEQQVLQQLCQRCRLVLAAGGGAVLRAENRAALQQAGPVVWLRADVPTILARLAADPTTTERRPNLTSMGGAGEVEVLLARRTPLYQACANLTIDTLGKQPAEIVDEILRQVPPLTEKS